MKRIFGFFLVLSLLASCGKFQYDVLVVGGGTSGTVAAIRSARAGASTLLVERGSSLGGTMTSGGVCFPGLFHAWGKQIYDGIGWELVSETVALDGGVLPDFQQDPGEEHYRHQILINAPLYSALAEEKCIKAGVTIRYYTTPVSLRHLVSGGWEVELAGEDGLYSIRVREIVDCTGDASVVALGGFKRVKADDVQPGSLIFSFGGFDPDKVDYDMVDREMAVARETGTIRFDDCYHSARVLLNHAPGIAVGHVPASGFDSCYRSSMNIAGRESVLRLLRFLRTLPGLENLRIVLMQAETGIRETWRIEGEYTITVDDYVSGRDYDDSIANSFYPIDLHTEEGVEPRRLPYGVVPKIPLRALVPRGARDLIVAGRSLSCDREALSALRVQASSMAMGEAAGAAAALAAIRRCAILDVPAGDIRGDE